MPVDDAVDDFLSEVGHADFIEIGKTERGAHGDGGRILMDGTLFNAGVAAGLSEAGQEGTHFFDIPVCSCSEMRERPGTQKAAPWAPPRL